LFVVGFKYLLGTYEKAAYLLFIGLIAGNLPEIFKQVRKCGFKKQYLIGGAAAFAAALAFGIFAVHEAGQAPGGLTAGLPILALSGFLGGMAALVPGMSVSMILIITGVYGQLLFAANDFLHLHFTYLLPFGVFGLCALAGLVLASTGIKVLFERYPGLANAMVLGIMGGALVGLLVQSLRMTDENFTWVLGGIMLAAGLGISMLFVLLGRAMEKNGQE